MKKLFFLFYMLSILCCSPEKRNCGDIVQKYSKNGKYFFALTAIGGDSGTDGGPGDVFGDTEVTKEIYNSYNVGDGYCLE
jgi:hypothetical protein